MIDEPTDLILDYLLELKTGQFRLENTLKDIQAQLHSMSHSQVALSNDSLRNDKRLAEVEIRLEK